MNLSYETLEIPSYLEQMVKDGGLVLFLFNFFLKKEEDVVCFRNGQGVSSTQDLHRKGYLIPGTISGRIAWWLPTAAKIPDSWQQRLPVGQDKSPAVTA